jgi:dCMP deaminase
MLTKDKRHDMYLSLARNSAHKSKCPKRQVGAIIVKNGSILGTGYNGIPFGILDCVRENLCMNNHNDAKANCNTSYRGCIGLCAEQIAIINAARKGIEVDGATLYCTHSPCIKCAMCIVAANIAEVIYEEEYPNNLAMKFLEKAGVSVKKHS